MELSLHEPVLTTLLEPGIEPMHARKKLVEIRLVVLERMKMYTHDYVIYVVNTKQFRANDS